MAIGAQGDEILKAVALDSAVWFDVCNFHRSLAARGYGASVASLHEDPSC